MCIMTTRKPLSLERQRDADRLRVIWERVREEARHGGKKLTQIDVSNGCGWETQGAFSAYVNGRTPLNLSAVSKLSSFFRVAPEEISPELSKEMAEAMRPIDERPEQNVEIINLPVKRIPVLTYVQAGNWRECITQNVDEYVFAHVAVSDRTFAAKIKGTSMMPEFKEGEVIIIDTEVTPQPGDFVFAQNGQKEATFKKYRARGYGEDGREIFDLVPLNADYATMQTDSRATEIIGVIVEHVRMMR